MNKIFAHICFICIVYCATFFMACTVPPVSMSGGSGTGVGNGVIMGTVLYPDSSPVANAIVRLRTFNYLADTSGKVSLKRDSVDATVSTDSKGRFLIEPVSTHQTYYIEVNDEKPNSQATLYIDSFLKSDTMNLQTRTVKPVTKISGNLTINHLPANAYIQIFGLEKVGRTDSGGRFTITDLPEGKCEDGECSYRLLITTINKDGSTVVVEKTLQIEKEGNSLDIELEGGNDD